MLRTKTIIIRGQNVFPGNILAKAKAWSAALWLVPVISVADLGWAITAKMGLAITFGLGLYKWEMIHIIIQVSLIIALSLSFVALSPSGEESIVVGGEYVDEGEKGKDL